MSIENKDEIEVIVNADEAAFKNLSDSDLDAVTGGSHPTFTKYKNGEDLTREDWNDFFKNGGTVILLAGPEQSQLRCKVLRFRWSYTLDDIANYDLQTLDGGKIYTWVPKDRVCMDPQTFR